MNKLKKCPFCGGSAELRTKNDTYILCVCTRCGASTRGTAANILGKTEAEQRSLEFWNIRTEQSTLQNETEIQDTLSAVLQKMSQLTSKIDELYCFNRSFPEDIGKYKMNTTKFAGQTLDEIYNDNVRILKWMAKHLKTSDLKEEKDKLAIRQFLKLKNENWEL